jgi:hypothetical protein
MQCIADAPCKDTKESKDSKDKCEYDRLSTWQEENCADKDSKGGCEDCCEYYCDEKHDKDDCFDEWENCVDDVSTTHVGDIHSIVIFSFF